MKYAWLVLALMCASNVHAQIGSRGAVEVVREGDNVPTPPPEDASEHAEAIELVPVVEPTTPVVPPVVAEPTPVLSGTVEPEPEVEPVPAARAHLEVETSESSVEIPRGDAEPQPRPVATESLDRRAEPTTVVVAREADPLVHELQEFVSIFGHDGSGNLWGILLWFVLAAVGATAVRRVSRGLSFRRTDP